MDSKGNFGKVYSRDMAYAASRYTEAKLSAHLRASCSGIMDCDAVDFVDNYDNTIEGAGPAAHHLSPMCWCPPTSGIAVGMASQICGFNLGEVCDTTIAYLKNPDHDLACHAAGPGFPHRRPADL